MLHLVEELPPDVAPSATEIPQLPFHPGLYLRAVDPPVASLPSTWDPPVAVANHLDISWRERVGLCAEFSEHMDW